MKSALNFEQVKIIEISTENQRNKHTKKLIQQKTTNPPPPQTQKGAKTLSNPHKCPILPRGGGGRFQLTGALQS